MTSQDNNLALQDCFGTSKSRKFKRKEGRRPPTSQESKGKVEQPVDTQLVDVMVNEVGSDFDSFARGMDVDPKVDTKRSLVIVEGASKISKVLVAAVGQPCRPNELSKVECALVGEPMAHS